MNGEVLQSIQQIQRSEEAALQRAKSNHATALRAALDSDQQNQERTLQSVGERAASGDSWQLRTTEKDFEWHANTLANETNPSGTAASFNIINHITREIQMERPPNKGAESTFTSILLSAPEHEASIGIKAQPEVAADLEAMHDDLPLHSIVQRIARNLVPATSAFAITGESFFERHEKIILKF